MHLFEKGQQQRAFAFRFVFFATTDFERSRLRQNSKTKICLQKTRTKNQLSGKR